MSTIKDAAANAAANALGDTKKAFLVIHNISSSGFAGAKDFKDASVFQSGGPGDFSLNIAGDDSDCFLQVQYNPSSLDFNANAEQIPVKSLQQNVIADIPQQFTKPPSVTLSVDLVFDAMNVKDSFMSEKFSTSTGGIASAGLAALNKEQFTVQPQTNALLALLMFSNTHNVTFYWSDLMFYGIVMEARAKYTMFSVSGRPVRSFVTLMIQQDLGGTDGGDGTYWDKAFDKCFGDENSTSSFGGQSAGQSVGNLFNLGF
ncbi:MAG: hypothetical protein LBB57_03000 [Clostridiales Family XIII bacterium]|nr:hypothetical protein [Clostridiales Family XIII bacterium]